MEDLERFSVIQDAIHELGNIGMGAAATTLFSLFHIPIETKISPLEQLDCEHLPNQFQLQKQIVGILYPFDKDVQGFALFVLEQQTVADMLENLLSKKIDFKQLDRNSLSLLQEVCSLMISSYFTSTAQASKMSIRIQLPAVSMDMKGSILNDGLSYILQYDGQSYYLDHQFKLESNDETNHLLVMFSDDSIYNIMDALEV